MNQSQRPVGIWLRWILVSFWLLRFTAVWGQTLPITFTNSSLPHATAGQMLNQQLTATGGTAPYTWTANPSMPFPAGIAVSPQGVLQGTASAKSVGASLVSLHITDAAGQTAAQPFEFWVDPAPIIAVNSGGSAAGRFQADSYYGSVEGSSLGQTATNSAIVDTAGLNNPPPAAVFQTERFDPSQFVYTLAGLGAGNQQNLVPGITYLVRLYFAETAYTNVGARQFDVTISGAIVLHNFDILAEAGHPNRAVVKEFTATAQSISGGPGGIEVGFVAGAAGQPKVNAIEILPATLLTSQVPAAPNATDATAYELGVRFQPLQAGEIRAIRYYRSPSETGSHTGTLWSANGTVLASVSFQNETASGWQEAPLSTPIHTVSGIPYVVSVNANQYFADTYNQFSSSPLISGSLQAVATSSAPNGLFGSPGTFPTQSFANSNYFRDVVFVSNTGSEQRLLANDVPAVVSVTDNQAYELGVRFRSQVAGELRAIRYYRAPGETGTHTGHIWTASGTLLATVPFTSETATGWQEARLPTPLLLQGNTDYVVSSNSTYFGDTYNALTYPGLRFGFLNTSGDATNNNGLFGPAGSFPASSFQASNYFRDITFAFAPAPSVDLFGTQQPDTPNASDNRSYELGVRLNALVSGQITGLRYYKSSQETGTHTGHVWDANGQLLGTATFNTETASGWQQALLATPLTVQAGNSFTVSVNTNSYFPTTLNGLAQSTNNGYLSTMVGNNGVFGNIGTYPTQSYQNSNYFRDVLFTPAGLPVTAQSIPPYIHRGYLGWIRDLASEPRPTDTWPSIVIDDQLLADYVTAAKTLTKDGLNEFQVWGLAAANSYSVDVEQTADATRVAQIKQLIDSLHQQGLKVIAGTGIYEWGFQAIVQAPQNSDIACTSTTGYPIAQPFASKSWDYQRRIIDYLFSFGIDGITLQPGDMGRCQCGPDCNGLSDAQYFGKIINQSASYVRQKYPNAILGVGGYGLDLSNSSFNDVAAMLKQLDYYDDVGNQTVGFRRQLIQAIAPTQLGSIAAPGVSPPLHWDRKRWFLPTFQHQLEQLQSLTADGGRASENFMRILANPSDEVSMRLIAQYERNPGSDWHSKLDAILTEIYQPANSSTLASLRQIFIDAENAYFNNASVDLNNDLVMEPLVSSSVGPPVYLRDKMSSSQRAAYKTALLDLQSRLNNLKGQVGNADRLQMILDCIGEVLNDLASLP